MIKKMNLGFLGLLGFGMIIILLNLVNVGIIELLLVVILMGVVLGGLV